MTVQAMRGILQTRLLTLGWADQTAFEGKSFSPTAGAPYQEVTTAFFEPDAITVSGSDMQRGTFQVRLLYPITMADGSQPGIGPQTARAEAIAAIFPRNAKFSSGGQTVKIMRKPAITRAPVQGDRDVTIVRMRFSDR
jgi:hypothetical protein